MDLRQLRGTHVTIVEVGPRDGLQNEATPVATADKVTFVDRLTEAGLSVIEATAFVSPKWVPQMADAAEVMAAVARRPGVRYRALVPNVRGFERAVAARSDEIAVVTSASETFNRKNLNQSIDASMTEYGHVCRHAAAMRIPVRGYLSTVFGCPYEGAVSVDAVVQRTHELVALGVFEVALSDTIGVAHPRQIVDVLERLTREVAVERLALHLHDTYGTALANVVAGLLCGVRTLDASAGGLGGCPYAPGAAGNLATNDLLYVLDGLGVETGVSAARLDDATRFIASRIGHPLTSRYVQARSART